MMTRAEKQEAVDGVHTELNNIFADLMEIRADDGKSRDARRGAISALMRARKKLEDAGLSHSVATRT